MEIMMFVVGDPEVEAGEVDQEAVAEWDRLRAEQGVLTRAMRLRPADEAVTVRVRGGETIVTDGPFAESKEWIAGYDLLAVDDLDEAIELAEGDPLARHGALELRPFWPLDREE
ncbi:YciI family protein [Agromyces terreus]|nr:YciI family protein [Agromyces terreus]